MHACPECGQACYCSGDIEDHDTGEEYGELCAHYLTEDCTTFQEPDDAE